MVASCVLQLQTCRIVFRQDHGDGQRHGLDRPFEPPGERLARTTSIAHRELVQAVRGGSPAQPTPNPTAYEALNLDITAAGAWPQSCREDGAHPAHVDDSLL